MRQGQLRAILGLLHRVASPDGGPGDAQLLDRWRDQRDPAAFELLVWRHGALVWNLCRRILHNEQDVEDAFQATFLTFLRKADTIGEGRFLASWLYKVAYRIALAARAASVRDTVQALDGDIAQPDETKADDLGPALVEEVHRLPEKYRQPVVLCYLEGKTTDEAARDLGCPRGTVGTRLAWARQRLRSRLARRGVALSAGALVTLLAGKASAARVPAQLVLNTVQAATLGAAGKAVTAGVISARVVALSQGVLQTMFMTRLKMVALVLLTVGILGSGAGLLTHQALAATPEEQSSARVDEPPGPTSDGRESAEDTLVAAEEDKEAPAPGKGKKEDHPPKKEDHSPQLSGSVARADGDGKSFAVEVHSKQEGTRKVDIKITDRTRLLFSNVGPKEARVTEGYHADVWLEKDSKDTAARVHLRGKRYPTLSVVNEKLSPPQLVLRVAGEADGKDVTLERAGKGEQSGEKVAIKFTEKTRTFFANVPRDGAKPTKSYQAWVWLEDDARDTARAVKFVGDAEGKPPEGKGPPVDRSGRVVGLSSNGKVLTVEVPGVKKGPVTKIEIKLTGSTRESYHGVPAGGARPVAGDQVQVWLAEGSNDTAARVRFTRHDPRGGLHGKVVAVSADGGRITVQTSSEGKGGEAARREVKLNAKTRLVFLNVGPGGASPAEGDHVFGWLAEGSEDTADDLTLSRPETKENSKPDGKKEK